MTNAEVLLIEAEVRRVNDLPDGAFFAALVEAGISPERLAAYAELPDSRKAPDMRGTHAE